VLKLLLVVFLFAAVTYAVIRVIERRNALGSSSPPGRSARPGGPARRPVAPDDDEDFLRGLDHKRREDPPA